MKDKKRGGWRNKLREDDKLQTPEEEGDKDREVRQCTGNRTHSQPSQHPGERASVPRPARPSHPRVNVRDTTLHQSMKCMKMKMQKEIDHRKK